MMPRYNVEYEGLWACFSTIVDNFVCPFLPREEYDAWRKEQYGSEWEPIEKCNVMDIEEAIEAVRVHHRYSLHRVFRIREPKK